jgi:hypothetical protein
LITFFIVQPRDGARRRIRLERDGEQDLGLMACKELGTLRAQPGSKPPMLHHNVLAIALANKLARIAWTWGPAKEGP